MANLPCLTSAPMGQVEGFVWRFRTMFSKPNRSRSSSRPVGSNGPLRPLDPRSFMPHIIASRSVEHRRQGCAYFALSFLCAMKPDAPLPLARRSV